MMASVGGMHVRAVAVAAAVLLLVAACRLNPAFDEESTAASGLDSGTDTASDSGPEPTGTGGDTGSSESGGATGGGSDTSDGGDGSTGGGTSATEGSSTTDGSRTTGGNSTSGPGCSEAPEFPDPAGPYEEFTITNAELDGSGEPWLVVAPGQMVELRFDYETSSCACPNCIVQGLVGFLEDSWRDCFYEGIPDCAGVQSQAVLTFAAPLEPGEHTLSFDRTMEYACQPDLAVLLPAQAFAGVCVQG